MCGIAGILSPVGANPDAVRAMTDIQAYRGPDGEGQWSSGDGRCVLGHRRLAILDLSERGRQPMVDAERGLAITYNGEIYNFVELRERLRGLGHLFASETDTEVLLHAYAQWGADCLAELNGMFAFAIWDERRRTLFCARDRFGEKPFLYAAADGAFVFASEAKALALLRGVDTAIDAGVAAAYAEDGHTRIDAGERTLLRGIKQLLPAHAMEVRLAGERAEVRRAWCYWSIDVDGRGQYGAVDPERAASDLLELMTDSVRLRLRSDVPVGSCLSGGLDSSSLVCLIRRLETGADLRTFTGRFPDDPVDEGRYASMVVEQCRTEAFEVAPTPERFAAEAERVYWHADFPIGGTSQFAQWCVFHLASQNGVTVLLDGQGSDELLGGYGNRITASFLRQLWAQGERRAWLRERAAAARGNPEVFSWPRLLLNRPELAGVRGVLRRHTGRSRLDPRIAVSRGLAPRRPAGARGTVARRASRRRECALEPPVDPLLPHHALLPVALRGSAEHGPLTRGAATVLRPSHRRARLCVAAGAARRRRTGEARSPAGDPRARAGSDCHPPQAGLCPAPEGLARGAPTRLDPRSGR